MKTRVHQDARRKGDRQDARRHLTKVNRLVTEEIDREVVERTAWIEDASIVETDPEKTATGAGPHGIMGPPRVEALKRVGPREEEAEAEGNDPGQDEIDRAVAAGVSIDPMIEAQTEDPQELDTPTVELEGTEEIDVADEATQAALTDPAAGEAEALVLG